MSCLFRLFAALLALFPALATAQGNSSGLASRIDGALEGVSDVAANFVFGGPTITEGVTLPIILVILGSTAVFLTVYFKFINLRGFGIAFRTVRGKYTDKDAPGQITHFQALSAALSATVGLGNIAGVAVAVGIGGPGATFWMIIMGLCGMTTKFAECTLGVKYRRIQKDGTVRGGAMYYLRDGFKEIGMGRFGGFLAILFAIFVLGGAFGAGNMFQANQAFSQFHGQFMGDMSIDTAKLVFGCILAGIVAAVILGGIVRIAHVTAFLVPFMCGAYVLAALFIIVSNIGELGSAFGVIFSSAFSTSAVTGGLIGVLIQGIKRAAFSNEAGLGSAPIAHAAVKTNKPASEGFVALLEPFVDTVVVCTMTALVIVITGTWQVSAEVSSKAGIAMVVAPGASEVVQQLDNGQYIHVKGTEDFEKPATNGKEAEVVNYTEVIGLVSPEFKNSTKKTGWVESSAIADRKGVPMTSLAFGSKISWFPKVLTIAVVLFAFSTMISWSYYGEQGIIYLFSKFGDNVKIPVIIYKVVFCLLVIVGSSASLSSVINLSDAMIFAMVAPNLIGLYFLLPVIKKEANDYLEHVKRIDNGEN
ncbi:MAG: sodium:alanine symporter [Verrucomicrobiales bacterium]|nr:sodium:alanine symporter [Verrucomicrobiales bacterium]|tara:strand:- start:6915 stop:8681 length:1767 start_codon:yes stop_codon:yes gene_type:complete